MKWYESDLAESVGNALVILALCLGIGGCYYIATTADNANPQKTQSK